MAFENFISLGYYCGTAAAMSKLGIRSISGPFDWYTSDLAGVLQCLESDFYGFLEKIDLEMENDEVFIDTKRGFRFNHEIKSTFESDYHDIYNKYMRRIGIFREYIKQKTCFIRTIQNKEELIYIKEKFEYIEGLIKRYNKENEIIYVISDKIEGGEGLDYPYYIVDSCYSSGRRALRSLFDSNIELQSFCINNFDEKKRYQNMVFDLQQENRILEIDAYRYELMLKIDNMDVPQNMIPTNIIIYGAGNIGKRFCKKIKNKCKVLFFVDMNSKEEFFEDIPIINYKDFDGKNYSNIPIIVTPCYEYEKIRMEILRKYGEINLLPLTDFFS